MSHPEHQTSRLAPPPIPLGLAGEMIPGICDEQQPLKQLSVLKQLQFIHSGVSLNQFQTTQALRMLHLNLQISQI